MNNIINKIIPGILVMAASCMLIGCNDAQYQQNMAYYTNQVETTNSIKTEEWFRLNMPEAVLNETECNISFNGVSGNIVAGTYSIGGNEHAYIFDTEGQVCLTSQNSSAVRDGIKEELTNELGMELMYVEANIPEQPITNKMVYNSEFRKKDLSEIVAVDTTLPCVEMYEWDMTEEELSEYGRSLVKSEGFIASVRISDVDYSGLEDKFADLSYLDGYEDRRITFLPDNSKYSEDCYKLFADVEGKHLIRTYIDESGKEHVIKVSK